MKIFALISVVFAFDLTDKEKFCKEACNCNCGNGIFDQVTFLLHPFKPFSQIN